MTKQITKEQVVQFFRPGAKLDEASGEYYETDPRFGQVNIGDFDSIAEGATGFCCCGVPESALGFLANSLKGEEGEIKDSNWVKLDYIEQLVIDDPKGAAHLLAYFFDKEGYTTHGGSVFGAWQEEKGRMLAAALRLAGYA